MRVPLEGLANRKWRGRSRLPPSVELTPTLCKSCDPSGWGKQLDKLPSRVPLSQANTLAQCFFSLCASWVQLPSSVEGNWVTQSPASHWWALSTSIPVTHQGRILRWLFPVLWTYIEMNALIACILSWRGKREIKFWLSHSFIRNTVIFYNFMNYFLLSFWLDQWEETLDGAIGFL